MTAPPAEPLQAVYFDCDSTLTTIEGIDQLLDGLTTEARDEVLALTRQAMEGTLPLAEVYETRLQRIAPSAQAMDRVGRCYVDHCVADAREVVVALRQLGMQVGIISGGLLPPLRHLGAHLGIEEANIHGVPLMFDSSGAYVDFDRRTPLWRNGGKVEVIRSLPADHRPLAFVGDGITDLETVPVVARFIGFGGVAVRAAVRAAAAHWVGTPTLAPVLRHCLTTGQMAALGAVPEFAALVARAHADA